MLSPRFLCLVEESMWHDLHEVKVILRDILHLVLKILIYSAVLLEHVEDGMLTVVDLAEMLFDMEEIVSVAKSNRVDYVIHLDLVFVSIFFLVVLLELFNRCAIVTLLKLELSSNLAGDNFSIDSARKTKVVELFNLVICLI